MLEKGLENVAVFLPTFNEEDNIEFVINDIRKNFKGYFFIVDGYSTDKTVSIAQRLGVPVFFREMHGKGAALRKALEVSSYHNKEFLLYFDCDRTYFAKDIEKVCEDIDNYDLVIGQRNIESIELFHRRLGNRIATFVINFPFGGKIKDSLTGFKCLRVNQFREVFTEDGFVIDSLICLYSLKESLRVKHVPIHFESRKEGSKMGFLIGLRELAKLVIAVFRARLGFTKF